MSEIRTLKRVSEEYILDPVTGLYYHLKKVAKSGSDQDFKDAINQAVSELDELDQTKKVYRPTAYLLQTQINAMNPNVVDWASENTYLMYFDYGCSKPEEIGIEPWAQEGNAIFIWSSNDVVYTWCTPDNLSHRFRIASEEEALEHDFEEPEDPEEEPEEPKEPETSTGLDLHLTCPHCGKRIF